MTGVHGGDQDVMAWNISERGAFRCTPFIRILCGCGDSFSLGELFGEVRPLIVCVWTAVHVAILTFGKNDGENFNHLLFHCHVAGELWSLIC